MPQQKDDERKRRFTPKVKTGCFNCRRRRIKCPEQFPVCKRCDIAQLVCEYPYNNSNKRAAAQATPLRPRPLFAVEAPDGTALGDGDADLFGVFCSSIVHASSGVFNKRFWKVDVPRAATAYPAVWHAGIALAAIHLSVRKNDSYNYYLEPAGTSKPLYNSSAARNHQYLVALSHFHQAMLHLSKALNARRISNSKFTYADQEMAILTNLLFIGITGMLEDPHQIQSHYKNLFRLLESVGFGNDNVNVQDGREDGITDHDELRTVVLDLEGTYPYAYDLSDDQAVKIPSYDSFTSLTQAYTEFMVLLHGRLACGRPNPPAKGQGAAGGPAVRLRQLAAFEGKLAAFEKDAEAAGSLDQDTADAIEYMRQHVRVMTIRLRATRRTSREDAIQDEMGLESVMEYLEQQLTAPAASSSPSPSLSSPSSSPSSFPSSSARPSSSSMSPAPSSQTTTSAEACPPPFVFSSSLGLLLEMVTFEVSSVSIRRRAIDLMRRFPYKEGGSRSEETVACTEAMILHELSGPERTRASQMAGMPIRPTYGNGGLKDREFDGTRECECIRDLFVCREHMVASFRLNVESERPYNELASRYELRYGLPRTKYYF